MEGMNMVSLRTFSDFENIKAAVEALNDRKIKNVTIVGGGFIGWEIASTLKQAYKDKIAITVVDQNPVPHAKVFGSEVAKVLRKLAIDAGINYEANATIKGTEGFPEDNQARNLILTNKNMIASDIMILAIGVQPITNFAGDITIDSNVVRL